MNVIARFKTHQGFGISFKDTELTRRITEDVHADGLNVSNTLFPKLEKDHPAYEEWVEVRDAVKAVMLPRNLRNKARAIHVSLTLPTENEGEGVLVESLAALYDAKLLEIKHGLEEAKPKAKAALDQAIEYAKRRKNGAFRSEKYPTPADIDNITFEWDYLDITGGSSKILMDLIEKLGSERAEQVRQRIQQQEQARVRSGVESALVKTVSSLAKLSEMLANPDSNFMTANIENAVESSRIAKAQMHDLIGDSEIDATYDQVIAYISNIDVSVLKKDKQSQQQISAVLKGDIAAFGEIGKRKFNL